MATRRKDPPRGSGQIDMSAFLPMLQKEMALAANPNVQADSESTGTGWKQKDYNRKVNDPRTVNDVKGYERKQGEANARTYKRQQMKRQGDAEQAIWAGADLYDQTQRQIPQKEQFFRQSIASQVPITRENETTGGMAQQSMYAQQAGPWMDKLRSIAESAKTAALQPSQRDTPYQQTMKEVQRLGPAAAMPIIPLLQAAYHVIAPHGDQPNDPASRYAQQLASTAQGSTAPIGIGGNIARYGSMANSMAGDLAVAGPLMHGTALAQPGHRIAGAASEAATRYAPRLAEYGMESAGRAAQRALPKVAEAGYETGVHSPLWGSEKLMHAAAMGGGGAMAIDPAVAADALRQLGIQVPRPPQTLRGAR